MNESRELTSPQMDKLASDVWETVSAYPLPADDPSFYAVKNEVRSYLKAAVKAPFFFALEVGENHYTASFVLGVGNQIKRIAI